MARPRVESSWPSPASWACRFALSAPASKSAISFLLTRRPTSIPSSTKAVDRYDIPFMQRALDLARKGTGLASPNPMVGAIVVGNGEVLGEGFHRYESRDHAEIVALKSALTLDGQLALPGSRKPSGNQDDAWWITSPESRAEVQRMRHASDALLTGIGTILADDPLLTDRSGLPRRRRLLRVILDSGLRLSPRSRVVESAEDDLLVFTLASTKSVKAQQLERAGVQIVKAPGERGRVRLDGVLKELAKRDILSVLLEAGSELNGAALAAGVVQKLFLFYAPKVAGEDGVPFTRAKKLVLPPLQKVQFHRLRPHFPLEGYLYAVFPNHLEDGQN